MKIYVSKYYTYTYVVSIKQLVMAKVGYDQSLTLYFITTDAIFSFSHETLLFYGR